VLSHAQFLNVPARVIAPALVGRFDCGHGRVETIPDFHVFHRDGANFPTAEKADALQRDLAAAGLLPADVAPDLPRRLFREDLLRAALHQPHTHELLPSTELPSQSRR
jgi:two-component system, oxyanion-binding sensor